METAPYLAEWDMRGGWSSAWKQFLYTLGYTNCLYTWLYAEEMNDQSEAMKQCLEAVKTVLVHFPSSQDYAYCLIIIKFAAEEWGKGNGHHNTRRSGGSIHPPRLPNNDNSLQSRTTGTE